MVSCTCTSALHLLELCVLFAPCTCWHLDMQILEDDARLLFHLQQQQLIELIRAGKTAEALSFAQECLAYKGEEDESLLDELGVCQSRGWLHVTMQHILLPDLATLEGWQRSKHVLATFQAFDCLCLWQCVHVATSHFSCACAFAEGTVALMAFPDPKVSPVKDLMQLAQREMTASELNRAILAKFCHDQEPKLASLLKLLSWGQERLAASVNFPKLDESDLAPHEGEGDAQEPVQ